jgi:hypothetical protein
LPHWARARTSQSLRSPQHPCRLSLPTHTYPSLRPLSARHRRHRHPRNLRPNLPVLQREHRSLPISP